MNIKKIRWCEPGFQRRMTESSGSENRGFTRPYVPQKILQDSKYICGSVILWMFCSPGINATIFSFVDSLTLILLFQAVMLQSFSMLTQDLVLRTSVEECVSKELVCHRSSCPNLSTTRNVHHIYHDAYRFHKAIHGQNLQVCLPREILVSCQLHNSWTLLELLSSMLQENVQEVPSIVDPSNILHGWKTPSLSNIQTMKCHVDIHHTNDKRSCF